MSACYDLFLKVRLLQWHQDIQGRNEEKLSRYGLRVIEELVVLCKHIRKHCFSYIPITSITDEIGTANTLSRHCKWYIHTNDFMFFIVTIILSYHIMSCWIFSSSSNSISLNLRRPMNFSCISVGSARQASRLCSYFCANA